MGSLRPLRGGCQCGRNSYIVNLPENASSVARVLFDADPRHRIFQASPLATFLRVPISWYHSSTFPLFNDEHSGTIRRTYTHPAQQATKRNFCGFCGTPLSYWSEDPPSEAEFIRLTLGSLCEEDLGDLEDLGLVPGSDDEMTDSEAGHQDLGIESKQQQQQQQEQQVSNAEASAAPGAGSDNRLATRQTFGIPWFESMVAGSRLGRLRTSKVTGKSQDGSIRYEWEVVEWTSGDDNGEVPGASPSSDYPSPSKRQKHDVEME